MIGFIGGGNMAEALIKGMRSSGVKEIMVSEPREERRQFLEKTYGVKTTSSNLELVSLCGIIVLSVKPQDMDAVLNEIAGHVGEDKTVVSIAAGVTLSYLQGKLKTKRLVRVMPNLGALVQESMSVMSLCECFSDKDINAVRGIFMASGKVIVMPEKYLNAVTALSGSGPAFMARFLELMAEAGSKLGLKEDESLMLAVQTFIGTAKLLEEGLQPSVLIKMVRSPGGTTAEGLKVFEDMGLDKTIYETLKAAARRAEELAR